MTKTTYEEFLEKNGSMTYSNKGTSMLPLLREGKDLFTVAKKGSGRCSKYDVVLYRRPPHSYVLHRVIKVRKNDYVILGDNCLRKEYGITDDDIIAVMTSFVHNGKEHSVNDLSYKLYSRFWVTAAPLRIALKKTRSKLRKLLKP